MREEWTYKKFEDCLVKAPKAKQVQTSEYNAGSKYPIISQEDKMISGYCDDSSLLYHIDCPIVIFGDHTRVLKYVDFDFVVGADGVKILIPKDFLRAKYLFYYLQWYKIPSLGYSRHYKLLKEINIPVPPLSEQQRIVNELDLLSSIIEKKKVQLKEYDQLAQSIFYDMFGDPVTNEKGWEVKKIGDFATCIAGATPSTTITGYWDNGDIPWLSSGEVAQGRIYKTERMITSLGYDNCSTKLIPPHTVLVALAGQGKTRGTVGIAEISLCTNQSICSILTDGTIDNDFLYYQLKYLYDELRGISNGDGGRGGLNLKLISSFKVNTPPLSLQQSFAEKIKAIEKQKSLIQQSIAETQTMFDFTMDKYFG